MDDSGWRSRIRWVVVHPDRPALLLVERAGALALPETELPAKVWTADAKAILPALRELVGFDAVLLGCVREHEDEAALVLAATLMATLREAAPPGPGARWAGREDLAGAAFPQHDQAMVAVVLDELAEGPAGSGRAPWAARGWFQAAEGWLRGSLDILGDVATGPVQQVQLWELSCILRVPTVHGDVWFKASRDSPRSSTRRSSPGSWPGCSPTTCPPPWPSTPSAAGWRSATSAPSSDGTPPSRSARTCCAPSPGCRSGRPPRSTGCSRQETGRLAGIDAATWLSAGEVAELAAAAPRLAATCGELAAFAVPATLLHGDLHLSNVAKVELAEPLGALHHAVSYRSIVANLDPPIDLHMMQSTAYWLRKVIAGLRRPLL